MLLHVRMPRLTCHRAAVHRTALLRPDSLLQPAGAQQRRRAWQQLREERCRLRVQAGSGTRKAAAAQLDLHHALECVVQR